MNPSKKIFADLNAVLQRPDGVYRIISSTKADHSFDTPYVLDSGWISVEDELPEDSKSVIAGSLSAQWSQQAYCSHGNWYLEDESALNFVTHWQPLPEPPEKKWKENDMEKD